MLIQHSCPSCGDITSDKHDFHSIVRCSSCNLVFEWTRWDSVRLARSNDELFEELAEEGCVCSLVSEESTILDMYVKDGLALRCDEIPHNQAMINPSYTYVVNDDHGKQLAMTRLFTT